MAGVKAADAFPEPRAARRAFDRAGARFAGACVVHDEARRRLLERLQLVRLDPTRILDLGCGTGEAAAALAGLYPRADVLAVDASAGMLAAGARGALGAERVRPALGDADALPLPEDSIGLVFANLLLPWCRPDAVLAEVARVLDEPGLFLFASVGPDTLTEVRRAWAAVDPGIHVHGFLDMHDLGDLALAAGLQEPVLDAARIELTYTGPRALVEDLRACGAVNTARGRRRGLTVRGPWRGFERGLEAQRRGERFAVTIELILGQAWGRRGSAAAPGGELAIPVDRIGRRPRAG